MLQERQSRLSQDRALGRQGHGPDGRGSRQGQGLCRTAALPKAVITPGGGQAQDGLFQGVEAGHIGLTGQVPALRPVGRLIPIEQQGQGLMTGVAFEQFSNRGGHVDIGMEGRG